MNPKLVMIASAVFLGILGVASQFLPKEILNAFGSEVNFANQLYIQLAGALYLGFGMLNWMAKSNVIGGVYSRPVAVANLTHFAVGAITLTKVVFSQNNLIIYILTIVYVLFALAFTKIVFTHPVKQAN